MSNSVRTQYRRNLPMNADLYGDKIDFQDLELFSLHAIWSGANGTDGTCQIYLEGSNDGVNWAPLNNESFNIKVTAASDNCIYDSNGPFCTQYMRVAFVAGDNTTGTMDLLFLAKSTK